MKYDIYMVGVGGQGIMTIGEILSDIAQLRGIPVNFFPSKGMAQRGGFVKAQLRLGRQTVGPNIPEGHADMVVAMEVSESLKAIRYLKRSGDFVLYGDIWAPMAVTIGKAAYPAISQVKSEIIRLGTNLYYIDPQQVPSYKGEKVQPNLYILGVMLKNTRLRLYFEPEDVDSIIETRWKRGIEENKFAFHSGLEVKIEIPEISAQGTA